MKSMSFKALAMTLAAIALVTSTACTRDKGGKPAQPGSGTKADAPPTAPQAPEEVNPGESLTEEPGQPQTSDSSPTGPMATAPRSQTGDVHYDPTGMTPEQIRQASEAQGPALVGPKSEISDFAGRELFYSGAGQDNIREIITAHNESRDEVTKQLNADLVRRIKGANVVVDWASRTMQVSVTVERGGGVQSYSTSGALSNSLTMSTTATRIIGDMSFDATCMDREGGCSTVHLMVQEKSVNGTRTAHVLVRKTKVSWFVEANALDRFKNKEFDDMLDTVWRRGPERNPVRRVDLVEMDTIEVIGGQSTFTVRMLARQLASSQWLVFTGPLVKPQTTSDTGILIDSIGRGSLSASIRDVRMTYNDGRGNIRAVVTVRKSADDEKEASMILTFARIHAPARELRLK